jgi:hypothetical protein
MATLDTYVEISNTLAGELTEQHAQVAEGEHAIAVLKEQLRLAEAALVTQRATMRETAAQYVGVKAIIRTLEDAATAKLREYEDNNVAQFR